MIFSAAGPSGKHRAHTDLEIEDHDEALDELIKLGATVIRPIPEEGFRWAVLQDPEVNEFCISAG
ncbi:MAG: VOC family protein [Chloroflexota bacterium]|jgi:predicted enzyme related to lactoylglutathione lyase